jgi:hypothetical protein
MNVTFRIVLVFAPLFDFHSIEELINKEGKKGRI